MTAPRRASAAYRKSGNWGQLLLSAGLAAAITSAAGVLNELMAARQQQCLLSQQIVGDETPNPALSLLDRQTLAVQADRRLRQCLGDRK
ncbi:MAG TPA: hypothetical protein VF718_15200 [Allosphingosinicella sp.]|jgi:hypothetical protein